MSQPVALHSNHSNCHAFSTSRNTEENYRLPPHTNQSLMVKMAMVHSGERPWHKGKSCTFAIQWMPDCLKIGQISPLFHQTWAWRQALGGETGSYPVVKEIYCTDSVQMRGQGGKSCLMLPSPDLMAGRMMVVLAFWSQLQGSAQLRFQSPLQMLSLHSTAQHSNPQMCPSIKARDLQQCVSHPLEIFLLSGKSSCQHYLLLG